MDIVFKNLFGSPDHPNPTMSVEFMSEFSRSDKMRHAYDMRQNDQHIIASYRRTGFEAGLKEGRAVGMVEALRDTARKMKASGMQFEDIVAFTGLSMDE
jgi:predicted transposase/invertase (TIGR01784 family)